MFDWLDDVSKKKILPNYNEKAISPILAWAIIVVAVILISIFLK